MLESIDWPCEVKTLFREKNLGCGVAVSEAISWFFEHIEQGIILEDDCLPNNSFFEFCDTLLDIYRDNSQVSAISGNNFQQYPMALEEDYYFSAFPSSWGWATWRRAWEGFEFNIDSWAIIDKKELMESLIKEKSYKKWWKNQFFR